MSDLVRLRASLYAGLPDEVREIVAEHGVVVRGDLGSECKTYVIERRHAERAQAIAERHCRATGIREGAA